jgi:hypothetical protein
MPRRCMRMLIVIGLAACSVHAQTLTFEPGLQPPDLEGDTYASRLIEPIPGEVEALLAQEQRASDARKPMLRAMMNFRMIAGEMLGAAERADRHAAPIYLHGMRMLQQRTMFDDLMAQCADRLTTVTRGVANDPQSVPDVDRAQAQAIFDATVEFNRRIGEHLDVFCRTEVSATDAALREAFEPIGDILALQGMDQAASHRLHGSGNDATQRAPEPDGLAAQIAQLDFSDDSRTRLQAMLEMTQRAMDQRRFVEQAAKQLHDLDTLCRMQGLVQTQKGLGAALRRAYEGRIATAIVLYADGARRDEARAIITRLLRSERTIRRIVDVDDLKTRRALLEGLAIVDGEKDGNDHERHRRGHERLAMLIDLLLNAVEEMPRDALPTREDRMLQRDLVLAFEADRRAVIDNMAMLADPHRSLSDPELSSLLSALRDHRFAIEALGRSVAWRQVIRDEAPETLSDFRNTWHALLRSSLDDAQRATAMRDVRRQARTCDANLNMPFAARLERNDPDVQQLTGSLTPALLANLRKVRHKWLTVYVEGGDHRTVAQQMDDVAALMAYCELAQQVAADNLVEQAQQLARWSMMQFESQAVSYPLQNWPARLKIACGALVQGDAKDLHRQVDLLRRTTPLVELIHVLHARHHDALAQMPDGIAGLVGRLRFRPEENDFAFAQREALAEISRYTHEHYHAVLRRDTEAADAIIAYRNGLIEQALPQLRDDS